MQTPSKSHTDAESEAVCWSPISDTASGWNREDFHEWNIIEEDRSLVESLSCFGLDMEESSLPFSFSRFIQLVNHSHNTSGNIVSKDALLSLVNEPLPEGTTESIKNEAIWFIVNLITMEKKYSSRLEGFVEDFVVNLFGIIEILHSERKLIFLPQKNLGTIDSLKQGHCLFKIQGSLVDGVWFCGSTPNVLSAKDKCLFVMEFKKGDCSGEDAQNAKYQLGCYMLLAAIRNHRIEKEQKTQHIIGVRMIGSKMDFFFGEFPFQYLDNLISGSILRESLESKIYGDSVQLDIKNFSHSEVLLSTLFKMRKWICSNSGSH